MNPQASKFGHPRTHHPTLKELILALAFIALMIAALFVMTGGIPW